MPFEFAKLVIPEVLLTAPRVQAHTRGFIMEAFRAYYQAQYGPRT